MIVDKTVSVLPGVGRPFGSPLNLPPPDYRVPPEANELHSFYTEPSFFGNQLSQDSKVIEGEVVARLLRNFNVFEDQHSPGNIRIGTLIDVISGRKSDVSVENIELAKMIFIMPGLLSKLDGMLDVDGVGPVQMDGNISKRTLEQLDIYHAPLRKARREFFKVVVS